MTKPKQSLDKQVDELTEQLEQNVLTAVQNNENLDFHTHETKQAIKDELKTMLDEIERDVIGVKVKCPQKFCAAIETKDGGATCIHRQIASVQKRQKQALANKRNEWGL